MKKSLLMLAVLLVGVLIFGCTAPSETSKKPQNLEELKTAIAEVMQKYDPTVTNTWSIDEGRGMTPYIMTGENITKTITVETYQNRPKDKPVFFTYIFDVGRWKDSAGNPIYILEGKSEKEILEQWRGNPCSYMEINGKTVCVGDSSQTGGSGAIFVCLQKYVVATSAWPYEINSEYMRELIGLC